VIVKPDLNGQVIFKLPEQPNSLISWPCSC